MKDATPNSAQTNNFHVMWSGGIIDTHDGRDFILLSFNLGI
jgi:hypothetical protein